MTAASTQPEPASLLDAAPVAVVTMELRGTILAHNTSAARWLSGAGPHGLVGSNLVDLLTPASRLLYETQIVPRLMESGSVRALTLEVRTPDTKRLPLLVNADLRTGDGSTPRVHIAAFDATARVQFEQELVQTRREAATAHRALTILQDATSRLAVARGSDDLGRVLADSAGTAMQARWTQVRILEHPLVVSGRAESATVPPSWGDAPPSTTGAGSALFFADIITCRDRAEIAASFPEGAEMLTRDGVEALLIVPIVREGAGGRIVLGDVRCWFGRPRTLGGDEVESFSALAAQAERVLDHLRLQDRLRHIAHHDALTGLPNRALFQERLGDVVAHSVTNGAPCAVMFMDLDGFKQINDERGHAVGDEVLRTVAERLTATCRRADTAARLGGDEFLIAAEGISLADAAALAGRVREAIRVPLGGQAAGMPLSASIGVVGWDPASSETAPSAADLVAAADALMYQAKNDGKDGVHTCAWGA